MVTVVVIVNILISLVLIYIAIYVNKLQHKLASIADRLTAYETWTRKLLPRAPEQIYARYQNIRNLHQSQRALQLQILQIQQIISLIGLGRKLRNRWERSDY